MKHLKFLPLVALACAAVACQNGGGSLSENSSTSDSLVYYLGQMNAGDYLREANRDTTMKELQSKQAYLEGVKAGLAALKEGDETYNKGVMMGMQMANNIINFGENTGVMLDKSGYVASLSGALMADTMPNSQLAQMEFRRLMTKIDNEKKERDQITSRETLGQVAKASNLPKIDDDLYGQVTSTTDGPILNDGDEVTAELTVTKENGEELSMPMPSKGKIGNTRSFPAVVSNAMLNLKSGETGEFMTTAHALLGNRAKQMNLEPKDVLKMTVKATLVPAEDDKDKDKK